MLLKVDCLTNAVGKQPSKPLINLERKWTLSRRRRRWRRRWRRRRFWNCEDQFVSGFQSRSHAAFEVPNYTTSQIHISLIDTLKLYVSIIPWTCVCFHRNIPKNGYPAGDNLIEIDCVHEIDCSDDEDIKNKDAVFFYNRWRHYRKWRFEAARFVNVNIYVAVCGRRYVTVAVYTGAVL